jgi:hypothetical protein
MRCTIPGIKRIIRRHVGGTVVTRGTANSDSERRCILERLFQAIMKLIRSKILYPSPAYRYHGRRIIWVVHRLGQRINESLGSVRSKVDDNFCPGSDRSGYFDIQSHFSVRVRVRPRHVRATIGRHRNNLRRREIEIRKKGLQIGGIEAGARHLIRIRIKIIEFYERDTLARSIKLLREIIEPRHLKRAETSVLSVTRRSEGSRLLFLAPAIMRFRYRSIVNAVNTHHNLRKLPRHGN